jgi:hypothetical protein
VFVIVVFLALCNLICDGEACGQGSKAQLARIAGEEPKRATAIAETDEWMKPTLRFIFFIDEAPRVVRISTPSRACSLAFREVTKISVLGLLEPRLFFHGTGTCVAPGKRRPNAGGREVSFDGPARLIQLSQPQLGIEVPKFADRFCIRWGLSDTRTRRLPIRCLAIRE